MTKELEIVEALACVTETSMNNDHALLNLVKVVIDTVHLMGLRIDEMETELKEAQDQVRALRNFLSVIPGQIQ